METKSPYRSEFATTLIANLLSHFGISQHTLQTQIKDVGNHFSQNGRPGYETLGAYGAEYDRDLTWGGYISDRQVIGNEKFELLKILPNDTYNRSRLLKYDYNDHEETVAFSFPVGHEAWRMALREATSGFFMVRTTSDNRKSYDVESNRATTSVRIVAVDWSGNTPSFTTIADKNSTYRPSSGIQAYRLGYGENQGFYYLPDSRNGFEVYGGYLIYLYSKGTDKFGVAAYKFSNGQTSSLIEAGSDGFENQFGANFSRRGTKLIFNVTWRDGIDSKSEDYEYDLTTLS